MHSRTGLILALLALAACVDPSAPGQHPLPRAVAVALTSRGEPLTVFFDVQPNSNGHVDARIASGLELPGQNAVFAIEPADPGRKAWSLTERIGGARVAFNLPAAVSVHPARLEDHAAWFYDHDGSTGWRCALDTGACAEDPAGIPEIVLEQPGPGSGFRLELAEGTLRFHHAHQSEDTPGDVVATRVTDLLGVRWYNEAPSATVREYLDRSFRGRSSLEAHFGDVQVDGELEEWLAEEPAVVESPWQAAVRTGWFGPEDASFSVAVRWSDADVCFAGRLRDDALTPEDLFTVAIGRERWLLAPLDPGFADGRAVLTKEPFGWRFELCHERPPVLRSGREVPFAVLYRDHDEGSDADLLSTAPLFRGVPAGSLTLEP